MVCGGAGPLAEAKKASAARHIKSIELSRVSVTWCGLWGFNRGGKGRWEPIAGCGDGRREKRSAV